MSVLISPSKSLISSRWVTIAHKRQKNTKIGLKSIQNWGYVYPFLSGICSCQYLSNRKLALKTLRKGILSHVFTLIAYKEHGGNFMS